MGCCQIGLSTLHFGVLSQHVANDPNGDWDVRDPARPQRLGQPLTGHTGIVYSVAFAPDGHTLATGSYDGR